MHVIIIYRSKSIETLTELRSEESKRVSSFGSVDSLRNAVEIDSFIFQNYSVVVSSRKQPIPPQPGSCSSNFIHSNVSKSYMVSVEQLVMVTVLLVLHNIIVRA